MGGRFRAPRCACYSTALLLCCITDVLYTLSTYGTIRYTQRDDDAMESIFTLLNAAALLGWSSVLLILLTSALVGGRPLYVPEGGGPRIPLIDLLFVLEAICFVEVCRIAFGKLKGNLVLGLVLHVVRTSCLFYVLPDGLLRGDRTAMYVLYAWSITEVCRYPMYLLPDKASSSSSSSSAALARRVRLVAPLFTFPPGCAAEAYGAYRALLAMTDRNDGGGSGSEDPVKLGLLVIVILVNGLLGPTMAYPALLKKGLPALMGKKSEEGQRRAKEE